MAAQILINMWAALLGFGRDEEGQTMAEYGLLLAGIAVVVMVVVLVLGEAIADAFQGIVDEL
jgi:pilus assembly protein Flp/PilA